MNIWIFIILTAMKGSQNKYLVLLYISNLYVEA